MASDKIFISIVLAILFTLSLALISCSAFAAEQPLPLPRAHAHNDYEHPRPLMDALDHGFCSVEADIYLVDGQLLVAHDRHKVRPDRTLQSLYLDPLRARTKQNGGRVYPNGPPLTLLVDIKSEAESTYTALHAVLEQYADIASKFENGKVTTNALFVVISGNRPHQLMASQSLRYAAIDGRLPDLDKPISTSMTGMISDNWTKFFKWRGLGPLPQEERQRLREFVTRSHAAGCKIRFWAIPDNPAGWQEMWDAGVDFINTDNLSGLRDFIQNRAPDQ